MAGYARSGKDTFAEAMVKIFSSYGIKSKTYAFATSLKRDIDYFTKLNFSISSFTIDDDEKKIIRPILVGYGESWRKADPNHWVNIVDFLIQNEEEKTINIVTDVRYENEADWILNKKGHIIYLNRKLPDGTYLQAANNEEALNSPLVKNKSSFDFCWETISDETQVEEIVESIIITLFGNKLNLWKQTFPL